MMLLLLTIYQNYNGFYSSGFSNNFCLKKKAASRKKQLSKIIFNSQLFGQ